MLYLLQQQSVCCEPQHVDRESDEAGHKLGVNHLSLEASCGCCDFQVRAVRGTHQWDAQRFFDSSTISVFFSFSQ